ncbi:hypothetical protein QBC46DRAFT_359576, partial [Diplogelasinospora grovesii]
MEKEKVAQAIEPRSDKDGFDAPDDASPPPPLSNPPAGHNLVTLQYNTLDDLMDDLHEWSAQALFGVRKMRVANKVKDFGMTRVDISCRQ